MPEEEKLEFLKREEIRTMAKDIAILREIEAKEEKEKITFLKPEDIKKEKIEKPSLAKEVKEEAPVLIPKLKLKKSLLYRKILIRAAMVLVVLLLLGNFSYGYFTSRKPPEITPPVATSTQPIVPTGPAAPVTPATTTPEIIIPISLISVNATETLEISAPEEASTSLSQFLAKELATGTFTRILIKDVKENKILGLKEFLESLEIKTPENFYQKIDNDFTLFVYAQEEGKRVGFITKIKESEGLGSLLRTWEPTMEADFGDLFKMMNKQGKASSLYFKNAFYRGIYFRYQTFSIPHFGICYSTPNQYFIFTSSGKSIMKIIEQLTKK